MRIVSFVQSDEKDAFRMIVALQQLGLVVNASHRDSTDGRQPSKTTSTSMHDAPS